MPKKKHRIELGDRVEDPITGFTGIAVVRAEYLQGCARIGVQPKAVKGEIKDTQHFDEPQLIKTGTIKLPNRTTVVDDPGGYQDPPQGRGNPK